MGITRANTRNFFALPPDKSGMSTTPPPLGYHLILRLQDDRVIASDTASQRLVARVVFTLAKGLGLLTFRLADTHLHLEVLCNREDAGELVRRLEIALGRRLKLPGFDVPRIRPIANQQHLSHMFFYILRQAEHHSYDGDMFFEASNLPDLLGLRGVGLESASNVCAALPRVRSWQLQKQLGVESLDPDVEGKLDILPDAAAAAFALPDLIGRSAAKVAARCAAVNVARGKATLAELAALLACDVRTIKRARAVTVKPDVLRAVRRQWLWRSSAGIAGSRLAEVGQRAR